MAVNLYKFNEKGYIAREIWYENKNGIFLEFEGKFKIKKTIWQKGKIYMEVEYRNGKTARIIIELDGNEVMKI